MVNALRFLTISWLVVYINANFTKISRNNELLSRRRRYLAFPMGSNLVLTMSLVKAIMQVQPQGWNFLLEVDVPFALPSDTKIFKNKKTHNKERRAIYSQLEAVFTENGLNGIACVERMICDSRKYIPMKGKSLVKDLLMAIFASESEMEFSGNYSDVCDKADCEISFLEYMLKSIENYQTL